MAKSRRTRKRNDHKATVGEEPGPDISLLSRPTATSVKGLKDILKAFEEGTPEVHHLLSNECEIVYECRVCRSLYRSFLNFITHKRIYCQQQYTSGSPKVSHFFNDVLDEDETVVVHNEPVRLTRQSVGEAASVRDVENTASTSSTKPKQLPRKNLTEILGLLSQKASSSDGLQRLVSTDGFTALNSLVTATGSDQAGPGFKGRIPRQHLLQLESLESTDVAIRQTVTLGPDGKILPNNVAAAVCDENEPGLGSNDMATLETKLVCTKCDSQFSNSKTYKHHITFVHDPARFFYLCPCCKSKFSNSWSVHRHLKSVHNKTTEQMRRLREQIQRVHKWEPGHDKPSKAAAKQSLPNDEDLEQEKLYNERQSEMEVFEKEYNKCSGCNRSFDRLAAFNYHVRNCSRRIMALNTNLKAKKAPLARKEALLVKPNEPAIRSKLQPSGDNTGESSAQFNDECADLKPRQRQNSEKRLEPAATKKIEIQLRRDYNKITAAPMNEEDEQENMPAGQEELSPTSINKIVASLVDYSKSLPAVPSSVRPINGEDGGSEQNCESVGDSASYDGETPLRGNSRETSISPISSEEQVARNKNSSSGNANGLDTSWDQLSSSKSTSPSDDEDVLVEDGGDLSDSSYRPIKRMRRHSDTDGVPNATRIVSRPAVTIIKMKRNQSRTDSAKSILKGILSNENADGEIPFAADEDGLFRSSEVDDTPRSDGIDVMRTSIKDWNGFEENFRGFEEPVAKRIRAHEDLDVYDCDDSLSAPSFDYNDFDDSEDDFDDDDDDDVDGNGGQTCVEPDMDESCQIEMETENNEFVEEVEENIVPISVVGEATVSPPVQIAFRGHYGQLYQLIPHPDEGGLVEVEQEPIPVVPEVNSENEVIAMDEEVPGNQEPDQDQEDSGINVFKSNASGKVDVDEDILKVIFEEDDLTQAASMHFKKGTIIMGNGTFSLGTSGSALECVDEEGEAPSIDTQTWAKETDKERSPRRNSLEARPKSAMDGKKRSEYPSMPRRNSSSNDGDFKLDSGAEITPSSSMENLFPKTRPVRNRAKVHSADFIYDLSDEVVSEGILSASKPHQDEVGDKRRVTVTELNPHVMLVRTEDKKVPVLGRVKSETLPELPLDETINNNSTGCSIVNVMRKSVRAQVTKL